MRYWCWFWLFPWVGIKLELDQIKWRFFRVLAAQWQTPSLWRQCVLFYCHSHWIFLFKNWKQLFVFFMCMSILLHVNASHECTARAGPEKRHSILWNGVRVVVSSVSLFVRGRKYCLIVILLLGLSLFVIPQELNTWRLWDCCRYDTPKCPLRQWEL